MVSSRLLQTPSGAQARWPLVLVRFGLGYELWRVPRSREHCLYQQNLLVIPYLADVSRISRRTKKYISALGDRRLLLRVMHAGAHISSRVIEEVPVNSIRDAFFWS
jgi:hypothetical protein